MFTGIVRHIGMVADIKSAGPGKRFSIKTNSDLIQKLEKGITSVAINGSCHTVEDINRGSFLTYSSFESLKKTNLNYLKRGDTVNLELSLTLQSLMDGHMILGHVDGMGKVSSITKRGEAYLYRFTTGKEIMKYLVEKDSISIDGISLTIFNVQDLSFESAVIPKTIEKTNLSIKKNGDSVNLEVNIFAKYAYQFSGNEKNISKLEDWAKAGKLG